MNHRNRINHFTIRFTAYAGTADLPQATAATNLAGTTLCEKREAKHG
ncbi:hypothetical protein [Sphingomonas abietis]|uniref:Uncharacterized protein n=1 Tax=Sphingomonas abietis TaxID=3012344 RepID=A0ABY7NL88_9SPHN|nr:hypothetical protein [Sphingomonas abietis]WBO21388.1 hypothetical protein PBT88_14490 [Sphingomonas abietis]